MTNDVIAEITRNERRRKGVNENKILRQFDEAQSILSYLFSPREVLHEIETAMHSIREEARRIGTPNAPNPRGKLHLDSTKIEHWKHRERLEAWRRGERIAPITVDMALTQKCSFSCEYCYAGLQFNKASPEEWATYQNLLDDFTTIGHASGEGVRGVSLVSDGESTENPYFRDFVLYGKSKGIDMAVGTNGLKLNPDLELIRAFTYASFNISAGEREAYKQVMGVSDKQWEGALESIRESIRIKRENNLETTIGL